MVCPKTKSRPRATPSRRVWPMCQGLLGYPAKADMSKFDTVTVVAILTYPGSW